MKVFRVIDDGTHVLTTLSELKALRLLRNITEKHGVGWIDIEEVK